MYPGELGPAHPAGEADQEDDPVPQIDQRDLIELGDGGGDVGSRDRPLLDRGDTESPADTAHGFPDDRLGGRVGMAGELVDLTNSGKAACDRRHRGGERSSGGKASSETYPATVGPAAGRAARRTVRHQVAKSVQSEL